MSSPATWANMGFRLRDDESIIATYRPKMRLFLLRLFVIAAATAIGFGSLPGLPISFGTQFALALMLVVVWIFVFDDWQDWIVKRNERWILTNQRLVLLNPDADIAMASRDLSEIQKVRRFLWWGVRLVQSDRRVSVIFYVGPVAHVVAELRGAIAAVRHG